MYIQLYIYMYNLFIILFNDISKDIDHIVFLYFFIVACILLVTLCIMISISKIPRCICIYFDMGFFMNNIT